MHGTLLIYNNSIDSRKAKALEIINKQLKTTFDWETLNNQVDIKVVDLGEKKATIGIDKAKEIIKFLDDKPFELNTKFILVVPADKLTIEAQNALLKTLEEPAMYAQIILLSKSFNALLDTVLSRCIKIDLGNDKEPLENEINIGLILDKTLGQRLDLVEKFSKEDKLEIIATMENWIKQLRNEMLNASDQERIQTVAENIKLISAIKKDLEETNVNARLALEYLVLTLK